MSDPETWRALVAARELVTRRLLAPEEDPRHADVCIGGEGFRYLIRFWTLTGVLEASDVGWHLRFDGNEGAARARVRIAHEWMRAGAPLEWARAEADFALEALLGKTAGTGWGTA